MAYQATGQDFTLSPYTGLTRDSWIAAGTYMLEGMFKHIPSLDAPVVMPRQETKVTYPHPGGPNEELEKKAAMFEGLARSFFIAAPLIHIDPEMTLNGIRLKDYYKIQVLRACTDGDENCVGSYDTVRQMAGDGDSFRTFQQTVETCALVICLHNCRAEIWDTYTKEEQDIIAGFLSGYAHGNTVPQNWRMFNMLDLAFLHQAGYPIDRDIMRDHAQAILNYYAGDGWYRDGHSFDYYSCWAFQVYAPIWNEWYGYQEEPYLAARFEENSHKLMETYADFFDRDGFTMMWGRSNIYRHAATSAFDGNLMFSQPTIDPGLARRISSGSLLQFITRGDFLHDGVPALGFYGPFVPLIQSYSCAESPFWLGKAYLCLTLPEDHPFWTATENNGTWEHLDEQEVKETVLDGPALCFSNHQANGETILRTGKVVKAPEDRHGMWNYSKLCYNSKYPWESAPAEEVEAQQYVVRDMTTDTCERGNATFWHSRKGDVLYRRQFFNYRLTQETTWMQALNLADFTVPYGVIRADKIRLYRRPVELTLGAYGFPDNGTEVTRLEQNGAKAIVLKGHDAAGAPRQLAMTLYDGWDSIELLHSKGTNPDSEQSIIVYGRAVKRKQYGYEPYVMISQVITKESLDDFTEAELFPIAEVLYTDPQQCGGYGPVTIRLKSGEQRIVEFEGIEGNLQL